MLECLRDDYKGELECAKRQVWLKGDAVAKRAELVDRWEEMAEVFMSADEGSLLAEINDKVWDEKEKLKVRLCYENRSKDRPIYVPEYFVHERLIQLR
ncbi:unnamed protein product [Nippostrongylus brasiliensis]|uniref:Reverse transcriptase domain-containing protein n=1 Tax=Nippostrongylus brasiliensis TaxID=27835 RepID=A0A0N4XHL0_NIPBR|nr:unnamed protein product [Nippostrongylus brasiliensis]